MSMTFKQAYSEIVVPLFEAWEPLCNRFIITGSLALYYHGLILPNPKDVDLIMLGLNDKGKAVLSNLQKQRNPDYPESETLYSISYKGIDVDIFLNRIASDSNFLYTVDMIRVDTIQNVIKAKQRINRTKDTQAIDNLRYQIFGSFPFEAPF